MANPTLLLDTKVEIQSDLGTPTNITAISKDSEAVITATHDFVVGDIILIRGVVGMSQINGFPVRVKSVSTTVSFVAEGLDSTNFSDYVSGGTATKVTTFLPFDNVTSFSYAEPEPSYEDFTTIHDLERKEIPGLDSAPTATMAMIADPFSPAVVELREASIGKEERVVRVTTQSNRVLLLNTLPAGGRGFDGASPGTIATAQATLKYVVREQWFAS